MLSGNGRHRRPRQAPALLVAAGVTGSAIAIPLLAASGASAADGTTWDKVAQCETGGSWSENSGNGVYGGLKLTQGDWEKYGGLDYAPSADLASRNQQIAVAEKVLDAKGVGAFHICGLTSGLTRDSGSADVDTGVADGSSTSTSSSGSSSSSDSSESYGGLGSIGLSNSSGSSADGSSGASSSASPSASSGPSSDTASKSSKSGASASPAESAADESQGTGGSAADGAKGDDSDNSEQAVGSWSLVDTGAIDSATATATGTGTGTATGTATATATGTATGTGKHRGTAADESSTGKAASGSYTVRAGDSLASIADSLGVDGGWRALYVENKRDIGADPDRISAGQTLRLPG